MIRKLALANPIVRRVWSYYRSSQYFERHYQEWFEKYRKLAEERELVYSSEWVRAQLRSRLKGRNIQRKTVGECHSAIVTFTLNWELGMIHELKELGRVSVFDWDKHGFTGNDPKFQQKVIDLNTKIFEFLKETHQRDPLDWVLITFTGSLILKETLRKIRDELGIPTVNQWLDCKQNFEGGQGPHGQDVGQRDIASEFDLVWTSSRVACEWYMVVGARPVFLPEGFSPQLTPRLDIEKTADVGFLGLSYGLRPDYINALRRANLKVSVAGYGWPNTSSIKLEEMGKFFASSRINLGIGGIGYSMSLTTLKGRDFEVPGAGGVYLTTFNPDLAQFFDVGREIMCYRTKQEMVELALQLNRNPDARASLATNAYNRSMREHRWRHRFQTVLELLGIFDPDKHPMLEILPSEEKVDNARLN